MLVACFSHCVMGSLVATSLCRRAVLLATRGTRLLARRLRLLARRLHDSQQPAADEKQPAFGSRESLRQASFRSQSTEDVHSHSSSSRAASSQLHSPEAVYPEDWVAEGDTEGDTVKAEEPRISCRHCHQSCVCDQGIRE